MTTELYRTHRPKTFAHLFGQPDAVRMLEDMVKHERIPHALLLTGPSGVGKTSAARILRKHLKCSEQDFEELNAADARGIETVREIRAMMNLSPMGGKCRIWLIDEGAKLTGDAQSALLKMLEDTPDHVYFMIATTDPQKLLNTIRTRCTEIRFSPLSSKVMGDLVRSIAGREGTTLTEEVVDRLVEAAEGSARKALVLLNSIIKIEDTEEQLNCILSSTAKQDAFQIVKALLWEKSDWPTVAKMIRGVETDDWEGLRYLVLANATNELLKGTKTAARAYMVVRCFDTNWYDSKRAGLVAACYDVLTQK